MRRLLGGDGGFMLANEDVRFDFGQRGGDISLSVVFNDPRRPLLYDRGCFCFEYAAWRVERLRDVVDQRWPFEDLRPSISAARTLSEAPLTSKRTINAATTAVTPVAKSKAKGKRPTLKSLHLGEIKHTLAKRPRSTSTAEAMEAAATLLTPRQRQVVSHVVLTEGKVMSPLDALASASIFEDSLSPPRLKKGRIALPFGPSEAALVFQVGEGSLF